MQQTRFESFNSEAQCLYQQVYLEEFIVIVILIVIVRLAVRSAVAADESQAQ